MTQIQTSNPARVATKKKTDPDAGFMWRDRMGNWHRPENMATRHLFCVLRMIWNHTMTEDAQIVPFRRYTFGPTYTREYMIRAISAMVNELVKRGDMWESHRQQLAFMLEYLQRPQIDHKAREVLEGG